ncbi:colicin-10, partial [Escherichia coli]
GAGKIREEKQKQVTASETRINRINAYITQIQKAISQVSNNRNAGIARVPEAEENSKKAQHTLLNSQIKAAVEAPVSF